VRPAALLLLILLAGGCSFSSYGQRGGKLGPDLPAFIQPGKTTRAEVVAELGEPDSVAFSDAREVAFYRASRSYFVIVFGRAFRDELVVRYDAEGKVESARARRAGDSVGILLPPSADER